MQVWIKKLDINMEVKSNGIEFEVRTPDGSKQLGDCYLTMTGLVWCQGKTSKKNGIQISWTNFIEIMESKESMKAAVKAAKKQITT